MEYICCYNKKRKKQSSFILNIHEVINVFFCSYWRGKHRDHLPCQFISVIGCFQITEQWRLYFSPRDKVFHQVCQRFTSQVRFHIWFDWLINILCLSIFNRIFKYTWILIATKYTFRQNIKSFKDSLSTPVRVQGIILYEADDFLPNDYEWSPSNSCPGDTTSKILWIVLPCKDYRKMNEKDQFSLL